MNKHNCIYFYVVCKEAINMKSYNKPNIEMETYVLEDVILASNIEYSNKINSITDHHEVM